MIADTDGTILRRAKKLLTMQKRRALGEITAALNEVISYALLSITLGTS